MEIRIDINASKETEPKEKFVLLNITTSTLLGVFSIFSHILIYMFIGGP